MEQGKELILSWYAAGAAAVVGFVVGMIADFVIQRYFKKIAERTAWQGDEIIIAALAHKVALWGLLAGILAGIPLMPLSLKVIGLATKVVGVLLILSVTKVAARVAANLIAGTAAGAFAAASTTIFRTLAMIGVWCFGLAVVMNQLGVSVAPILTALGVGGLAVALALQDSLSNLFAGIHIILARQLRVGDYVKLEEGIEGYVSDINWRNTTIRALPNIQYIVPNSKLASSITTNYYLPDKEMAALVQVSVSYHEDLAFVEKVTIEVATEVQKTIQGGVEEFQPFIRYHTFGDSGIGFTVILRVKEFVDQYLLKHEFVKALFARYVAEGITIPFPQRTLTWEENSPIQISLEGKSIEDKKAKSLHKSDKKEE